MLAGATATAPASAQVGGQVVTPVGAGSDDGPVIGGNPLQTASVSGRAWTAEARLVTGYDTNFRLRTPGESAFRISPLVHVGAGLPIGRQQLFVGADIGRDIFVNKPGFNRGRYAIGGGLEWRLGTRCSGIVGAEALQRLVTVSDQDEFTNSVQKTNVVAGSLGCRTATGLGFGVSAQRREISNDLERRAPFDLTTTVISPNISYGSPTIGQFSVSATFNDTKYPNRIVVTPDGDATDGINILQGRVGYQRAFGARLQLALGASYLKTTPRPDAALTVVGNQIVLVPRDDFSGSGFDGSISYQPTQRMGINFAASRNVNVSPNVGAQFVIRNDYGVDFSYRIGPSLNFSAGGRVASNKYRATFATPLTRVRISDNSRQVFARLDYSPVPLYSIGLDVGHRSRRSDPAEFNFNNTTVRLNLRVKLGRG